MNDIWLNEVLERSEMARDLINDPEACRRYTEQATRADVPKLVALVRELIDARGGDFGTELRAALRHTIIKAPAGGVHPDSVKLAELHPDVHVLSCNISVVGGDLAAGRGRVIVDVRMQIGGA